MTVKAGYKGAVYIGAVKIGGAMTWTYTGGTRQMQAIDEFGDEHIKHLPLQIEGGEITVTGNYLLDTDEGQKLLGTRFDAGTEITDLKLYTDLVGTIYLQPKAGSYVTVTNWNNVGDDKSGVGTLTATFKVSGVMEQQGSTTVVGIAAVGIHALIATEANFVGRLLHAGGFGAIVCYFEYGTTIAYGTDTSGTSDTLSAPGLFEATSALLVAETTYHWRIHCTHTGGTVHVVGKDQTFTTPAA